MDDQLDPSVTVSIRGLRRNCLGAMAAFVDEWKEAIEKEVNTVLSDDEFRNQLRETIRETLLSEIKGIFEHYDMRRALREKLVIKIDGKIDGAKERY